jgi:UDP-glucose 4-epimerase
MKVLITGASGKLGKHVTEAMALGGHELILVTRDGVSTHPGATAYKADLAKPGQVATVVMRAHPEVIIHLASLLPAACQADPALAQRVNIDATRELANAAVEAGVARFIFASTGAVYNQGAEPRQALETDDIPAELPHPYSATKRSAEQALEAIAAQGGSTQFGILRIFNIYGLGFDDSIVNKLVTATSEQPAKLLGMDYYSRDFVHAADVAAACRTVAEQKTLPALYNVWNIASGKTTTNADLIAQLEAQGRTPRYIDTGQDVHSVTWADITKAHAELGFQPRTDIVVDF